MKAYYFGCVGNVGHFLHTPDLRHVRSWHPYRALLPGSVGSKLDGGFCPKGEQVQGKALLHHLEGWTVLAFWDRSVDKRGGCNSNFVLEGTLTANEAVQVAKYVFPSIWERYPFEVTVDAPAQPPPAEGEAEHG